MTTIAQKPLFQLGQTVMTPGALDALERSHQSPSYFLSKHQHGDWGEVCAEDKAANEEALKNGLRLMSVYKSSLLQTIWIITEADRSVTTILLPSEY